MSTDQFRQLSTGLDSPARKIVAITPSDTLDLPDGVCRALLVGTAGTVDLIDACGNAVASVPLQQGYNPLCVRRVKTGGTASAIFALY